MWGKKIGWHFVSLQKMATNIFAEGMIELEKSPCGKHHHNN